MSFSEYPSKLLENAVEEFASLPGIGRKTAFRLVMSLLKRKSEDVQKFGESIIRLQKEIRYCTICHNISDKRYVRSAATKKGTNRWSVSLRIFRT